MPYDPKVHIGLKTEPDAFVKKKKWALMQFDWLVKKACTHHLAWYVVSCELTCLQGDTVDTESSVERSFSRRLIPGDQKRGFATVIQISHKDRKDLTDDFCGC